MAQPLVGMDLTDLREALGPDQPGYRSRQIYEALYRGQATDFVQISTLPAGMRQELAGRHALGLPSVERLFESTDGTRRYLLRLGDGRTVETVLMPEGERDTICISSQVGCPVDCKFCMTALMGLERSLTAGEIVGQVLLVARENQLRQDGGRLNIVMMGQGEPLLNLPNVVKATRILLDPAGFAPLPAPDHCFHGGHHPQDRRTRPRAGPAQTRDLAQRLHRRAAAGNHADHPQISSAGPDGGLQSLSSASLGETDFRIRAAAWRQRYRCRRAPRGQTSGESERQSQSDRTQSGSRNPLRHAACGARGQFPEYRPPGASLLCAKAARAGYLCRLRPAEEHSQPATGPALPPSDIHS